MKKKSEFKKFRKEECGKCIHNHVCSITECCFQDWKQTKKQIDEAHKKAGNSDIIFKGNTK